MKNTEKLETSLFIRSNVNNEVIEIELGEKSHESVFGRSQARREQVAGA